MTKLEILLSKTIAEDVHSNDCIEMEKVKNPLVSKSNQSDISF